MNTRLTHFFIGLALATLGGCGLAPIADGTSGVDTLDVIDALASDLVDADGLPDAEGADAQSDANPDVGPEVKPDVLDQSDTDLPLDGTLVIAVDPPRLVSPIPAVLSATVGGKDVTDKCTWATTTPGVCTIDSQHQARRVAPGTCTITCAIKAMAQGQVVIEHKPQPVLYLFGGYGTGGAVVSRLRVADKEWDPYVTVMPYVIENGAVGSLEGHLFVVGGAGANWPPMDGPKDCPSDLPGCVGSSCKPGCVGTTSTACPKESVADPKPYGCGTIWRLDLADASWHAVGVGSATSFVGGYAQVGDVLYLVVHELVDLATATFGVQPGGEWDTGGNHIGSFRAPFGDGVVATQYGEYFSIWTPQTGVWKPAFQPQPCHTGFPTSGVSAFQSPQPTLVWTQAWNASTPECPPYAKNGSQGLPPYLYRTWLSTGGAWQPGPQLPSPVATANSYIMVSWSGGVFFYNDMGKYPTYLLASPGDHFEEFPPCPIAHPVSTMAVVVMQ